jgi:hypothetical protein
VELYSRCISRIGQGQLYFHECLARHFQTSYLTHIRVHLNVIISSSHFALPPDSEKFPGFVYVHVIF